MGLVCWRIVGIHSLKLIQSAHQYHDQQSGRNQSISATYWSLKWTFLLHPPPQRTDNQSKHCRRGRSHLLGPQPPLLWEFFLVLFYFGAGNDNWCVQTTHCTYSCSWSETAQFVSLAHLRQELSHVYAHKQLKTHILRVRFISTFQTLVRARKSGSVSVHQFFVSN